MRTHDGTVRERGATAMIVALSMLFLLGAAALAVDVSGFYGDARSGQTSADLACLAGAAELPDASAAIQMAAANAKINYPEMSSATLLILSSTSAALYDGTGNIVTIETNVGGDATRMRVTVTESADAQFAGAIGAGKTTIRQRAVCRGTPWTGSVGVPMGIIPGPFIGGLFGPNPCGTTSGNCGGLAIGGNGASVFEDNITNGLDVTPTKHHGPAGDIDSDTGLSAVDCDAVAGGARCSLVRTKTGSMAGPLGSGLISRLQDDGSATCTFTYRGDTLDCDTPAQITGSGLESLWTAVGPTRPSYWKDSIFGGWNATNAANHFYYDDVVAKCDSPRRTTIPVVDDDDDWDIGSPISAWPTGSSSDVKVIAMVDAIITDPNDPDDFQGSGSAKSVSAVIVWYGPNAKCGNGSAVGLLNEASTGTVRLVSG